LVTSVPVIHIHTQISAALIDGASFTPSHVIATTFHLPLKIFTISCLSDGFTLAITPTVSSNLTLFLDFSKSAPVITSQSIPSSFAIAHAVTLLSHVIIITRIHAFLHVVMESFTSSRGGSIIACNPTKVRFFSSLPSPKANPKTLSASSENVAA
jgi:predicted neutral ceramidase superfamily lipid hydrolase